MIKGYTQYTESIRHLLVGPTEDELFKNLGLDKLSPDDMLDKSIELGILKGVKLAIKNGADVHYGNDLMLVKSCDFGHYDLVKYILSIGLNRWVDSGLRYSCQKNRIDIVKLLLDNGADIHTENEYCLKIAVEYYYFDLTKYLLKRGANIHATNDWCIKRVNSGKSGYTKFKNLFNKILSTNEGIRHLLVGPTNEEVWQSFGYDRTFDTPDKFMVFISDNLVEDNKYLNSVYWRYKPTNEIYFEYQYTGGIFYYNQNKILNIFRNIFNISYDYISSLIKNILIPKINKSLKPRIISFKLDTSWKNIK